MGGYQNFLRRMNAGGNTMRNEQIENALHLVRQTFADDPSYIPDGVPYGIQNELFIPVSIRSGIVLLRQHRQIFRH